MSKKPYGIDDDEFQRGRVAGKAAYNIAPSLGYRGAYHACREQNVSEDFLDDIDESIFGLGFQFGYETMRESVIKHYNSRMKTALNS